jgi:transforming growth factor-beta-induced protein
MKTLTYVKRSLKSFFSFAFLALGLLLISGKSPSYGQTTVVDIVVGSANHTTLEAAVIAAGLADDLSGAGPFTVFAPTDAAFAALPAGTVEALLTDPTGDLADILLYHVLGASVKSTDLSNGQTATTLLGKDITVTINANGVFINNAKVTVADIMADNGVVHVIDAVMLPPVVTVVDIVVGSANHTTLEAAVIAAGLADDLSGAGPFTVFAPTDAAFAALPAGTVEALLTDPTGDLADILLYHVLSASVKSTDLSNGQTATTLLGKDITVTINANGVFINNAKVTVADIMADNGVVHVIDAVMLPPRISVVDVIVKSPIHKTLETLVIAAGLADDLNGEGPFTVFAPTDEAFANAPEGFVEALHENPTGELAQLLLYHVLPGTLKSNLLIEGMAGTTLAGRDFSVKVNSNGIFVNNAKVIVTDIMTDNGVIHVVDAVMIPPAFTVVDIVTKRVDLTILESAVIAAGLADDLSGAGPFTVFAPTDAAFTALPAGTLETLLTDPTGDLADILLYHVLGASVKSTDLTNGQTATTLLGKGITVTINANGVFINNAKVTVADIMTDNGVVHVIDAVLLPPVVTVVDIVVNSPNHTTLEAAVIAAGLADDLSGAGPFTVFAPTDAAFAALPAGTVETLLADPTGDLADILLYHVLGASVKSTDLSNGQTATTLLGKNITVTINANGVFINNAKVTVADIMADNGVVHVIDAVLLPPVVTVVDIVVGSANHNTLETAVIAAGLADDLSGAGPFTVFAPTDAAFAALPAGTLTSLLADPTGALTDILLYHVLSGKVKSTSLRNNMTATTLFGKDIKVTINANGVFINNAKVTVADIMADNGVVHVIDAVLLPPVVTVVDIVVGSANHTTLEAAVIAAGLADDLSGAGPFTVFAPTDAAFAALPAGTVEALLADPTGDLADILLYHVLGASVKSTDLSNGQTATTLLGKNITVTINANGVFINNAKVTVADIMADNGVVHVIDAVLLPPVVTVVDIVVGSANHTTLEAAVIAAGLADDLSGAGPFTVFAPTDAAFAALPAGTVEALLADPTGDLADILLYHVLGASVKSTDLSDGQTATTLLGKDITVKIDANGVFINNAKVTVADIMTDNGVVHVIDAVLLPPSVSGISNLFAQEVEFRVFPNPATEYLNVAVNSTDSDSRVAIFRVDGVKVNEFIPSESLSRIDLKGYVPGMYFITYTSGRNVATGKFIVK